MLHNTLLIVTYDEERYLLETLLQSVHQFLEPCNIVLINGDVNPHVSYDSLRHLVPNHTFATHLINPPTQVKSWKSWCYALKILGAELVTTPTYWVLDTKCFFYRTTLFAQMEEQHPINLHNIPHTKRFGFRKTVEQIEQYYGIEPMMYRMNTPPFRFDTVLAQSMSQDVLRSFDTTHTGYAEMLHYQAWCRLYNHPIPRGTCVSNNSIVYPDQYTTVNALVRQMKQTDSAIRVTGIHREILDHKIDEMTYQAIVHAVTGCRWKWDSNWTFYTLPNQIKEKKMLTERL